MLGEDADWLAEVANEMKPEDGLIWVCGPSDDDNGVMAFTDDGIEALAELVKIYKASPRLMAQTMDRDSPNCGLRRRATLRRALITSKPLIVV